MNYHPPLYENELYHIYNRGNNGENLFYKPANYLYFLKKYDAHLSDYLDTFCYCLLPNHFHLLVRVKPYSQFPGRNRDAISSRDGISKPELIVSEQFRKLFIGYALAINKQENRTGSLFQKNFKRKPVKNEHYFTRLIYYIHANPQLHGLNDDFRDYPYSSYERMLNDRVSKLMKREVLNWFGSKSSYMDFHDQKQELKEISQLMIEED